MKLLQRTPLPMTRLPGLAMLTLLLAELPPAVAQMYDPPAARPGGGGGPHG